MDYSGYISTVLRNNVKRISIRDLDRKFLENQLLCQELFYGPFSIYNIHSLFKKSGVSIAYKNVHQKVHRVLSLGLLEETRGPYSVHAAKFYRLSLNGWINLIAEGTLTPDYIYEPAIKRYYNTNIIFRTFLYPFFELETLTSLESTDVGTYLENCCETTIRGINVLKITNKDPSFLSRSRRFYGIVCPLRYREREYADKQSSIAKMMGEIIDYSEVEKIGATKKAIDRISYLLDLQLKSFLFEQVMKNAAKKEIQSVLSKDRKFVASIQDLGKEFTKNHDRLFALQQNT
ncbi:MAG: hypothetical protein DLM72_03320 [Candidatus Nitrosopolaris wilkensis]|nr:MAG: hypothetical protein DLM72_03320 [Candidatus Nitrosopolaris wilkensis]